MTEPKIEAGEKLIDHCPLCVVKYSEPLETNVKHTCPNEGGCGRTFLLKVFD